MTNNTICNVQPSQNIAPRIFTLLPNRRQNLRIHYTDLFDSDENQFCKIVHENRNCFAKQPNHARKKFYPSRTRLKPDAKLQTQKSTKDPIQKKEKVNDFLIDLQKTGIIKQISLTPKKTNFCNYLSEPIDYQNRMTLLKMF